MRLSVEVNNGHLLSDGLNLYQKTFGDFFISIIRIGELSGTLTTNLVYLAEELKKAKVLQNKVRSAMVYPGIVFVAMGFALKRKLPRLRQEAHPVFVEKGLLQK